MKITTKNINFPLSVNIIILMNLSLHSFRIIHFVRTQDFRKKLTFFTS